MADKVLSPQEDETLLQGFEKTRSGRIGVGKHEEFHKTVVQAAGYLSKTAMTRDRREKKGRASVTGSECVGY